MRYSAALAALGTLLLLTNSWAAESSTLETGYDQMYNMRFDEAHQTFRSYQREHPTDPMGPASDAAAFPFSEFNRSSVLQSQFLSGNSQGRDSRRLLQDTVANRAFESALKQTDTLVAADLQKNSNDPNAVPAKTFRLGLHADYLTLIQKRELAAQKR